MNFVDLVKKFKPFHKLKDEFILNSDQQEMIYESSYDDIKSLHYRIFKTIPSTFYSTIKATDMEKILDFFADRNFELFSLHANDCEDRVITALLINEPRKVIAKIYYSVVTSDSAADAEDDPFALYFDDAGNSADCSVFLSFFPDEDNTNLIDGYEAILTKDKSKDNEVYMFEKDGTGRFKLIPYKIEGFDIDIKKHYNDDFGPIDEKMKVWCKDFETLNKRLVMLAGVAGTGKTNYIKHILGMYPEIRKIYIPPYYIEAIADPAFFGFIRKYANSILILEDSEKVLVSRNVDSSNSGISVLLNLTDGILASVLNFKIICTFNTKEEDIDAALKRKGRLFTKYHFDKLSPEKTKSLYNELYSKDPPEASMSLGDIYNVEDNGIEKKEERKVGFGS